MTKSPTFGDYKACLVDARQNCNANPKYLFSRLTSTESYAFFISSSTTACTSSKYITVSISTSLTLQWFPKLELWDTSETFINDIVMFLAPVARAELWQVSRCQTLSPLPALYSTHFDNSPTSSANMHRFPLFTHKQHTCWH